MQFPNWLTSPKSVLIESPLSADEAMSNLRAIVLPLTSWRRISRLASRLPLVGAVSESEGKLLPRDFWPSRASGRYLRFSIEPSISGSRLVGVLIARPFLRIFVLTYWLGCILSVCYEIVRLFMGLDPAPSVPGHMWLDFLGPVFGFLMFLAYYHWVLWQGRKREAALLLILDKALNPPKTPSPSAPHVRQVSPPTPTEVFFPPRKSVDH